MALSFRTITVIAFSALLFGGAAIAQDQQPNEKKRDAAGTKKDVEKRLKAAEKPQPGTALDPTSKALLTTHRFDSTAISPDGTRVAWTEALTGKDGAADGNAAVKGKLGFSMAQKFSRSLLDAVDRVASTSLGDDCGEGFALPNPWETIYASLKD